MNNMKNIIDRAYSNKIIKEAIDNEYKFRAASNKEVLSLINDIAKLASKYILDIEKAKKCIISNIDKEIALIEKLNKQIENYAEKFKDQPENLYPLTNNKMNMVLNGAKYIISEYLSDICIGKFPIGYEISNQDYILSINDSKYIHCNSKGSYLKTALIETRKYLSDEKFYNEYIDQSSILHIVPIEEDINIENFINSDYFFSDEKTPKALVTIHNGYAFGGQREHKRYLNGKEYGPEDCSSWIAKILKLSYQFNTIDLYKTYIARDNFIGKEEWTNSSMGKEMIKSFKPIEISDPLKDIKIGQIYSYRKYESDDPDMIGLGIGGHTAIIIDVLKDGNIITISNMREMPDIEGYCIKSFPIHDHMQGDLYCKVFYLETQNNT